MGILNLAKLLADIAPQALKENELKTYFGKVILPLDKIKETYLDVI